MQCTGRLLQGLSTIFLGMVVVVVGVIVTVGEAFVGAPIFVVVGSVLFVHGMFTTAMEMVEEPHRIESGRRNVDLVTCC